MNKTIFSLCLLVSLFCLPNRSFAQWDEWHLNLLSFDSDDTLWQTVINIDTVYCHRNQWQVGSPRKIIFDSANSYPNTSYPRAIVTDTASLYLPDDTSKFTLRFPESSDTRPYIIRLDFYYKLNTDGNTKAFIEFSNDSGVFWINLKDTLPWCFGYDTLRQCEEWMICALSLPGYANGKYMLRFSFISGNDTSGKEGWMIDNFEILYDFGDAVQILGKNNLAHIYPNPAINQCTINYNGELFPGANISIVDGLGRRVGVYPLTAHSMQLPVVDLLPGIYNCIVNAGNGYCLHQKLVVVK